MNAKDPKSDSLYAEHLAEHAVPSSDAARAAEEAAFAALLEAHPEHEEELKQLRSAQQRLGGGLPGTLSDKTSGLHRPAGAKELPQSAFHAREGVTIGDFRLTRLLGRGGMGEVWEAEQTSLSRKVALKLMLPDRVSERGLDFFAREARAGGRLAHKGIVSVFGTGEDDGAHWIAMELVDGACDLKRSLDAMRDEAEVPEGYYEHTAGFIAELADALEVAHQAGVIHRDLKPANILVAADDSPKVSDFGLAKLEDELSISSAGELLGTYYYMSPEQVATKRAGIDFRTDIFSMGVVMYEMLTLVRPFEGDTTEQVAQKILWEEAPDPKAVRSRVPRDLAVICGKAMEKDPGRRYQSMAELAEDLRRHLAHEPIQAKPPAAAQRVIKWTRRNPTKSTVGAVGVAALAAISWLSIEMKQRAAEAEEGWGLALEFADGSMKSGLKARAEQLLALSKSLRGEEPEASLHLALEAIEVRERASHPPLELPALLDKIDPVGRLEAPEGLLNKRRQPHAVSARGDEAEKRRYEQELIGALHAAGAIVTVTCGQGMVMDVAVSPNGERLATISAQGVIQMWRVDTGEQLWRSDALANGLGTVGEYSAPTGEKRDKDEGPRALRADFRNKELEETESQLMVFFKTDASQPGYLFNAEDGELLEAVSPQLNAVARTGWLLRNNELSSSALAASMRATRGMRTSYVARGGVENWDWCSSTQASWFAHQLPGNEKTIRDLQTGEVLHRIPVRLVAIDPAGEQVAYIDGGQLHVLHLESGARSTEEIAEIVKPQIWRTRDEGWFAISSSLGKSGDEGEEKEMNIGERAFIYRWEDSAERASGPPTHPTLLRVLHLSSLNLGQVIPQVLPQADAVFLSAESGKCLVLPLDPHEHARRYCARSDKALPEWRRRALGLLDKGAGK